MRAFRLLAACIACLAFHATEVVAAESDASAIADAARQEALDNLMAERGTEKQLLDAVQKARAAGVGEQAILEARFLYRVDKGDDAALAAMLPEFIKRQPDFKLEESAIFGVEEDWLAVIEYLKSLAALESGDREGFKRHITEAFWLSPRQAGAFARHIERVRMEEVMRRLKVDFTHRVEPVLQGDGLPLADLMRDKKALLLHFWSPWSHECEEYLPDFMAIAKMLSSHGIAVASLLPGDVPDLLEDAREMLRAAGHEAGGAWLVDPAERPLARMLRVRNLPVIVLIAPNGAVLFNGSPTENDLWKALSEIDAAIRRPAAVMLPDGVR